MGIMCQSIIKFVDDTTVVGRITHGNKTTYREEVLHLVSWCSSNNLHINIKKTKELIIDSGSPASITLPSALTGLK
ncbi:hypothetical protein LDENG_00160640 [Lucifuga dentata]|nr:hypothetical protein LDENG_00160640 [Lucifuga dentata]